MHVAFYSRHLSLRDAIDAITAEGLCAQLERFAAAAPALGLHDPVVAVAGLNPHCGENGLFGREEIDHIEPGIALARARGLNVVGPIPADSVFHQHRTGRYDALLSLYHDQVSAVLKGIDFHGVVSVTLGLPFIRLSVDHGTAFDIAGRNQADHTNMRATLDRALAWRLPAVTGGVS
jgi:4-hydroxythreonine-4-phosphate dehydrogenase